MSVCKVLYTYKVNSQEVFLKYFPKTIWMPLQKALNPISKIIRNFPGPRMLHNYEQVQPVK